MTERNIHQNIHISQTQTESVHRNLSNLPSSINGMKENAITPSSRNHIQNHQPMQIVSGRHGVYSSQHFSSPSSTQRQARNSVSQAHMLIVTNRLKGPQSNNLSGKSKYLKVVGRKQGD